MSTSARPLRTRPATPRGVNRSYRGRNGTDQTSLRLRQMAVQNNLQGKGIGASMMNFAELVSRDKGYKKLIMHARETAVGFYEKLGYKVVGDKFTEVTIPHYVMEKKL